jgi:hypothetical protein
VATLAWNGFRHFETYYAVAGSGRGFLEEVVPERRGALGIQPVARELA